jgi:hypothetical protein
MLTAAKDAVAQLPPTIPAEVEGGTPRRWLAMSSACSEGQGNGPCLSLV